MNELNFARFDARMGQRFAVFEQRMTAFESRIEIRLAKVEAKLDSLHVELTAKIETTVATAIGDQTLFLFLAGAALLAAIIPLYFK
jgi:hypothetical protein